jgi:uncharacterized protein YbjT (DUF2867 family)
MRRNETGCNDKTDSLLRALDFLEAYSMSESSKCCESGTSLSLDGASPELRQILNQRIRKLEVSMYVITGATGNTGRGIIERLATQRHIMRAIGRSEKRLRYAMAKGADPFVCDLADTDELTRAFEGALAVYVMIPPTLTSPDFRTYQELISDSLASAVEAAGVTHVVSLSSVGADKSEGTGPVVGLHNMEQKLNRISGLNVLHLRAGYFMENTFSQAGSIRSTGNCGGTLRADLKIPMIATRDISAVAADELLNSNFSGQETRELLGQRDISMAEVATILGKVTGQSGVKYAQMSDDQLRPILLQLGMPLDLADLILEMCRAMNTGHMKPLESRNERNTTPTSYETFAKEEFLPHFRQSEKMAA